MKPWHYARIKIPYASPWHAPEELPKQAPAGNWVFFRIRYLHDATKTCYRETHLSMHTLGMDGVTGETI